MEQKWIRKARNQNLLALLLHLISYTLSSAIAILNSSYSTSSNDSTLPQFQITTTLFWFFYSNTPVPDHGSINLTTSPTSVPPPQLVCDVRRKKFTARRDFRRPQLSTHEPTTPPTQSPLTGDLGIRRSAVLVPECLEEKGWTVPIPPARGKGRRDLICGVIWFGIPEKTTTYMCRRYGGAHNRDSSVLHLSLFFLLKVGVWVLSGACSPCAGLTTIDYFSRYTLCVVQSRVYSHLEFLHHVLTHYLLGW